MGKKWYLSKTFLVNFLAAIAIAVQGQYGFIIPLESQAYAIVGLNSLLRLVTKEQVVW